jgi:hypothetical protein
MDTTEGLNAVIWGSAAKVKRGAFGEPGKKPVFVTSTETVCGVPTDGATQ